MPRGRQERTDVDGEPAAASRWETPPRGLHPTSGDAGAARRSAVGQRSGGDDLPRLASQKLTRFAYVARYAGHDIRRDLEEIIGTSQFNNVRDDLTGVLVYDDGHFIQLLEGPGHNVTKLMMRVLSDPRAADVAVLFYELVDHRAIGEFTMLPLRLDLARNIGTLSFQFREAYRKVAKSHDIDGLLKLLRGIIDRTSQTPPTPLVG
ncbi:MAG: Blue light- and temperature-regulated antirepressor YcgF [Pseudomonadota bacterium]|jgi:hypothetical protein